VLREVKGGQKGPPPASNKFVKKNRKLNERKELIEDGNISKRNGTIVSALERRKTHTNPIGSRAVPNGAHASKKGKGGWHATPSLVLGTIATEKK